MCGQFQAHNDASRPDAIVVEAIFLIGTVRGSHPAKARVYSMADAGLKVFLDALATVALRGIDVEEFAVVNEVDEIRPYLPSGVTTLKDAIVSLYLRRSVPRWLSIAFPLAITALRTLIALRFEVYRIERLTTSDKEPIFHRSTKAEIGSGLRQMDFANEVAVGGETVDPVVAGAGPAGARPQIAVDIAAYAVRATG